MIHVTAGLLTTLYSLQLVWRDGTQWVTPNGHVVVADAGYTGSGPQGEGGTATQWAYATDMIRFRYGPIDVLPSSDSAEAIAQVVDRTNNDFTAWAGQFIGTEWDGLCHLATQFTTDLCVDAAPGS